MENMPDSAVSSWADFAQVDTGLGPVITLVLLFVQLVGLVAFGGGVQKIMHFVTPGHPKAPASIGLPIFQVIFGLFALVPMRVYELAMSILQQMGWL